MTDSVTISPEARALLAADCCRGPHDLLPSPGDNAERWSRCRACGALSRWSPAPVPSLLQRHAGEIAIIGVCAAFALGCLIAEVFQ